MNRRTPRRHGRRKAPAPLSIMRGLKGDGPSVYLALADLAAEVGARVVTPTREQLSQLTGIKKLDAISKALTALSKARWIHRIHVPVSSGGVQIATLLRIVLLRMPPVYGGNGKAAVSTRNRGSSVERIHPVQGAYDGRARRPPKQGAQLDPLNRVEDSLYREGCTTPAPLEGVGGAHQQQKHAAQPDDDSLTTEQFARKLFGVDDDSEEPGQ